MLNGSRDEYKNIEVEELELEDFSKLLSYEDYNNSLIEFADYFVEPDKTLLNEMFRRFKKYQKEALADFLDYYILIDEDFRADFVAFLQDEYQNEFENWRDYTSEDYYN